MSEEICHHRWKIVYVKTSMNYLLRVHTDVTKVCKNCKEFKQERLNGDQLRAIIEVMEFDHD